MPPMRGYREIQYQLKEMEPGDIIIVAGNQRDVLTEIAGFRKVRAGEYDTRPYKVGAGDGPETGVPICFVEQLS